jgi:antitoxin VapB
VARTAKLFKNGRSQAVRLPKEFRFPGSQVYIEKRGDEVVLRPRKRMDWKRFFSVPSPFPSDFLVDRKQPKLQKRRLS